MYLHVHIFALIKLSHFKCNGTENKKALLNGEMVRKQLKKNVIMCSGNCQVRVFFYTSVTSALFVLASSTASIENKRGKGVWNQWKYR